MIVYLYAKSGSKHAIDSRSMTLCKDLVELGEVIFNDMEREISRNSTFNLKPEDMIRQLWFFRVYEGDLSSKTRKLKKVQGQRLLDMLKSENELKTKFLKYKLRT